MRASGAGRGRHLWLASSLGVAAGVGAAGLVAFIGCGVSFADLCDPSLYPRGKNDPDYISYCTDPPDGGDAGDAGMNGQVDAGADGQADAGADGQTADASDDAPSDASGDAPDDAPIGVCPGLCAPGAPSFWVGPDLVWMGAETDAPPCPSHAPQLGYEGHADLVAPSTCGACVCAPPTGTCGLPATLTANAATCALASPGTPETPFDPPAGWDGSCTTHDAIPAGALCQGAPCAQSVTMAPLALNESACESAALPTHDEASWKTFVRTCRGFPTGSCPDWGTVCAVPPPDGFRFCILKEGDVPCPDPSFGMYQERHVFYGDIQDTRSCSPCTCGPPEGSTCSAEVSIYADDACASTATYAVTLDATKPACVDVVAGAALIGKSASAPVYLPGACEPGGGVPMGAASPIDPTTLCCSPSP